MFRPADGMRTSLSAAVADVEVRVPNQLGTSMPFEVSSSFSYGGSNFMSRNFRTSSVNFSTSRMENSYSSSQVSTPTWRMNFVSCARSMMLGVGVQAIG